MYIYSHIIIFLISIKNSPCKLKFKVEYVIDLWIENVNAIFHVNERNEIVGVDRIKDYQNV